MQEPFPIGFRQFTGEQYDGTADPMDHLLNYSCTMTLQGAPDVVTCRAFPASLKGAARTWYFSLGRVTVGNFAEFSRLFISHFGSSRRKRRNSASLMTVRQEEGEFLRAYLARFNAAAIEVTGLDQTVAVAAVMSGLRHNRLVYSLDKSTPGSLTELMDKAERYIQADEAIDQRKKERMNSQPPKRRREQEARSGEQRSDRGPRQRRVEVTSQPSRYRTPSGRFDRYTELNTLRSKILEQEKDKG